MVQVWKADTDYSINDQEGSVPLQSVIASRYKGPNSCFIFGALVHAGNSGGISTNPVRWV